MKKTIMLLIMLFTISLVSSQQLYVKIGKRSSSFNYHDSQNNQLDNVHSKTFDYLALGFKNEDIIKNVSFSIGLNYGGYGAIASDNLLDKYMEWNLKYLEWDNNLDYKLFGIRKIKVHMIGGVSFGIMTKGIQILDKQVIDLKENIDFEDLSINLKYGIGITYPISNEVSFIANYLIGHTNDISPENEKLKINSNNLDFGLLMRIKG